MRTVRTLPQESFIVPDKATRSYGANYLLCFSGPRNVQFVRKKEAFSEIIEVDTVDTF